MNGAVEDRIHELEGRLEETTDALVEAIAEVERLREALEKIADVLCALYLPKGKTP